MISEEVKGPGSVTPSRNCCSISCGMPRRLPSSVERSRTSRYSAWKAGSSRLIGSWSVIARTSAIIPSSPASL